MPSFPYRLVPTPPRRSLLRGRARRVGLRGVLAALDRRAVRVEVPGEAATTGFRWDERDVASRRWWPQGITTSADAQGPGPQEGLVDGRPVVLTSWYARGLLGRVLLGSRISVVDLTDESAPRYAHVLLGAPSRLLGLRRLRPVRVHAGGIVWYGGHLFVAGSARGIRVFDLDDVVRVRVPWRGVRFVLPQRTRYVAATDAGTRPMTYSFLSLDRAGDVDHLVAGEYGRQGGSHRAMRYALDRGTRLLAQDAAGVAVPVEAHDAVAPRMQGAVVVGGTWAITASSGEGNPGDLWVGRPGALRRRRGVLPTGPEDVTWWPQRDQLWSLTEWPGRRWVYGVDADPWLRPGTDPGGRDGRSPRG